MQVIDTAIPEVKLIVPKKFGDDRGFFSEVFSSKSMQAARLVNTFVQDNHSMSAARGVVRGLHYQVGPMAQDKLVRVLRGSILDVAVDIRRGSPTFGRHVSAVLSESNWTQILVPIGFAHGFVTLEPATQVLYKVTNYYSPAHERGILWNDPELAIPWDIDPDAATLSAKDKVNPKFLDANELFEYGPK